MPSFMLWYWWSSVSTSILLKGSDEILKGVRLAPSILGHWDFEENWCCCLWVSLASSILSYTLGFLCFNITPVCFRGVSCIIVWVRWVRWSSSIYWRAAIHIQLEMPDIFTPELYIWLRSNGGIIRLSRPLERLSETSGSNILTYLSLQICPDTRC